MEKYRSPHGKKMLTYSPEFAQEIIKSFQGGKSATEIANETGRKAYMIGLILKRHGLKPSEHQRHGNAFSEDKIQNIIAVYRDCKSTRETGKKLGIHTRVVREVLNRRGAFEPEWQEKPLDGKQIQSILDRWDADESLARIAIDLGVGKGRLKRILIENGRTPQERRLRGSKHASWKGGRFLHGKSGYWLTYVGPDDPMSIMASRNGYVMEHRLVVARALGRPLTSRETVHHINGDKNDNRLENLQIRHGVHGKGIVLKCADCGSHNIIEVPLTAQELKEQEGKP